MPYKILLAFDGSGSSERAAAYILTLLRRNPEVKVTALTVYWPVTTLDPYLESKTAIPAIEQSSIEKATKIQEQLKAMFSLEGRDFEPVIARGDPADVIFDHARNGGYDFLVMGTNARLKGKEVVMGSICRRVVARVQCPVMLVN